MILPKRGHLYIVDLEPRVGSKPGKQRPCICIQPTVFCESGLNSSIIIPLTTKVIPDDVFPIRVKIPAGTCGIEKTSDALIDQLLAWDVTLFKKDLGKIPEGLEEILLKAVKEFLDL